MNKRKVKIYILLQIILFIFSLSTVCSKTAGKYEFLSVQFIIFYGLVLIILGMYAIAWQQVIKRIPLMVAYANKAITIVWGLIWGKFIFDENISMKKIMGAAVIIVGIIIFSMGQEMENYDNFE